MLDEVRRFRPKRNWEEYYICFDFFKDIDDGATIVSATVKALDALGADKTTVLTLLAKQVASGTRVNVWVQGGTPQLYTISCEILTSTGEKYEYVAYQEVLA